MVYYLRVISLSEDLYFFSSERRKEKMLAIFNKGLVNPPQELHSPASLSSSRKPKHPEEIFKEFLISQPSNAFSINFGNAAALAYVPPENPNSVSQRYPLHHDYWDIWLLAISIFFSFLYMYPKLAQVVLWLTWHILHVHGELKQLEQPQQTIWAVKRLQWGHVCYWSIPDPPWSRPIPGSSGPARSWWQLWFCALWLQGWNYICSTGKSSKLLRL